MGMKWNDKLKIDSHFEQPPVFPPLEIPFKGDFGSLALDRLHIVGDSLCDFGGTMSHWYKTQQYEMEKLIGGQQIFIVGWNTYPLFLFRDITSLDFFTRQTARLCFHCAKTNRHITIGYLLTVWCIEMWCEICVCCAKCNPMFGVWTVHLNTFGLSQSLNYRLYYSASFDGRNLLRFVGIETLKHIISYKTNFGLLSDARSQVKRMLGLLEHKNMDGMIFVPVLTWPWGYRPPPSLEMGGVEQFGPCVNHWI